MKGQIVYSPSGEKIVLADVGMVTLLDTPPVRVWDVSLAPGETHPWHLHHNPYVVLSLHGSACRMDWLDGSEPRFLNEYHGGAVYRPLSPVHRLTNIGDRFYQNRLVELKDLGENRPEPLDIGPGARSVRGEQPGPDLPDGRRPVLTHPQVAVWTVQMPARSEHPVELSGKPHVVADDGVRLHPGGPLTLGNESDEARTVFLVELSYLS